MPDPANSRLWGARPHPIHAITMFARTLLAANRGWLGHARTKISESRGYECYENKRRHRRIALCDKISEGLGGERLSTESNDGRQVCFVQHVNWPDRAPRGLLACATCRCHRNRPRHAKPRARKMGLVSDVPRGQCVSSLMTDTRLHLERCTADSCRLIGRMSSMSPTAHIIG